MRQKFLENFQNGFFFTKKALYNIIETIKKIATYFTLQFVRILHHVNTQLPIVIIMMLNYLLLYTYQASAGKEVNKNITSLIQYNLKE